MATRQEIARELKVFRDAWPKNRVRDDLSGARSAFTDHMKNVGIIYRDQKTSKANNPEINGLHVGELLDMLNTLNKYQDPNIFLFQ